MTPDDERHELEAFLTCYVGPPGSANRDSTLRIPAAMAETDEMILRAAALGEGRVLELISGQIRQCEVLLKSGQRFSAMEAVYRSYALALARLNRLENPTQ